MNKKKGFTLIELLIVIAIIAILAAIIFVAVDPGRRLAEARNAQRWASVNSILNAYLKYTVDNKGTEPATLTANQEYMVVYNSGADFGGCDAINATTTNAVIILKKIVDDGYISELPYDPNKDDASAEKTYYWMKKKGNGRIIVGACGPETVGGQTPRIEVSR